MKRGIFSIILATALVLTLGVMPAVAAPTSISFVGLSAGDPVEGLGVLADDLELTHSGGQTLVVIETDNDTDSFVYSANLGSQNDTPHGGLPDGIGFGDPDRDDPILGWYATFNGKTVKWFSVTMYDYGDWFPHGTTASMTHTAKLIAYDADDSIIDEDVLTFTSTGGGSTGRISPEFGALSSAGDALQATDGNTQPGIWTFEVAASGTSKVEMWFDGQKSVDPGVGWAGLEFELEVYDLCGFKYADWEGDLIPLSGWNITLEKWDDVDGWIEIDWVETDTDGKYCFTGLATGTYRVSEVLKDGWDQLYPVGNEHIVTLPLDAHVVYGVERVTGDLYEIDILSGTETFIAGTGNLAPGNINSPNGLAFDVVNNRLYFGAYDSETQATSSLYFYDVVSGLVEYAGDVEGITAGAGFGRGAYWYIKNNTDDLYKVTFDADGMVVDSPLLKADITGDPGKFFRFGDLAISPCAGFLYGSSLSSQSAHHAFFSVELDDPYTYTEIRYPTAPAGLQLAYGSDGELYGHSTGSQEWYQVDITTGDFTFIRNGERAYTDLAQGESMYNFINTPALICDDQTAWAAEHRPGETTFSNANNWATYVGYQMGSGNSTQPALYPLYAGQHYLAGMLHVYDEDDTLYVKYTIDIPEGILKHYLDEGGKIYQATGLCAGDWTGFLEYHLAVGNTQNDIPRTRTGRNRLLGNPIPGNFEYKGYFDPAVPETGWFAVDISDLGESFVIAAHAVTEWCGYDCEVLQEIEDAQNGD